MVRVPARTCFGHRAHASFAWIGLLVITMAGMGQASADSYAISTTPQAYVEADVVQADTPDAFSWREFVLENEDSGTTLKLSKTNAFFNQLAFVPDHRQWGVTDYWATPLELLVSQGGDCEDFAIAKYFTLIRLGIPAKQMRLVYVKALTLNQAHMVLAYYEKEDSDPLILDNLDKEIKPASLRPDLVPVYSFNEEYLWLTRDFQHRSELIGHSKRLDHWREVLDRRAAERADAYAMTQ